MSQGVVRGECHHVDPAIYRRSSTIDWSASRPGARNARAKFESSFLQYDWPAF